MLASSALVFDPMKAPHLFQQPFPVAPVEVAPTVWGAGNPHAASHRLSSLKYWLPDHCAIYLRVLQGKAITCPSGPTPARELEHVAGRSGTNAHAELPYFRGGSAPVRRYTCHSGQHLELSIHGYACRLFSAIHATKRTTIVVLDLQMTS
jgi:hypothetical protein